MTSLDQHHPVYPWQCKGEAALCCVLFRLRCDATHRKVNECQCRCHAWDPPRGSPLELVAALSTGEPAGGQTSGTGRAGAPSFCASATKYPRCGCLAAAGSEWTGRVWMWTWIRTWDGVVRRLDGWPDGVWVVARQTDGMGWDGMDALLSASVTAGGGGDGGRPETGNSLSRSCPVCLDERTGGLVEWRTGLAEVPVQLSVEVQQMHAMQVMQDGPLSMAVFYRQRRQWGGPTTGWAGLGCALLCCAGWWAGARFGRTGGGRRYGVSSCSVRTVDDGG